MSLNQLLDHRAVTDLVGRLGRWLDDQRWAEADAVLTTDVSASTPGGTSQGLETVVAQAAHNHDGYRTQHVITDVLVELDGARAKVSANLTVTFAAAEAPHRPQFRLGERYELDAVDTPAGWRLARIAVAPRWREDFEERAA